MGLSRVAWMRGDGRAGAGPAELWAGDLCLLDISWETSPPWFLGGRSPSTSLENREISPQLCCNTGHLGAPSSLLQGARVTSEGALSPALSSQTGKLRPKEWKELSHDQSQEATEPTGNLSLQILTVCVCVCLCVCLCVLLLLFLLFLNLKILFLYNFEGLLSIYSYYKMLAIFPVLYNTPLGPSDPQ